MCIGNFQVTEAAGEVTPEHSEAYHIAIGSYEMYNPDLMEDIRPNLLLLALRYLPDDVIEYYLQ